MTATVSSIERQQIAYYRSRLGEIREADGTYNDLNRELIAAMKQDCGTAYIGKINFYGDRRANVAAGKESVFIEYTNQEVHNFSCDFVAPRKDEKLEELIREWNSDNRKAESCATLVREILDRVKEIGGINLIWF